MELTYTKVGDYYLPDLALDDDTKYEIGIYGRMRQRFLKEHHPGVYNRIFVPTRRSSDLTKSRRN